MVDLQCVFPQQAVQLTAVREIPGSSPRTLDIFGKDFRFIDEVKVNDVLVQSFMVVSKTELLVQVPDAVGKNLVQSVLVASRRLTVTPESLIRFKLGQTASKVSGILRLVQVYLKILLTTPGTDITAQSVGGDALKNVGRTFSKAQGGSIISDFVLAVSTTNRQLLAIQGRDTSIPLDERLLSARVVSSNFDSNEMALFVTVEIVSQAGQAAVANLSV